MKGAGPPSTTSALARRHTRAGNWSEESNVGASASVQCSGATNSAAIACARSASAAIRPGAAICGRPVRLAEYGIPCSPPPSERSSCPAHEECSLSGALRGCTRDESDLATPAGAPQILIGTRTQFLQTECAPGRAPPPAPGPTAPSRRAPLRAGRVRVVLAAAAAAAAAVQHEQQQRQRQQQQPIVAAFDGTAVRGAARG